MSDGGRYEMCRVDVCRGDKKGGDDSDSDEEDSEKSKLKSQLEGQHGHLSFTIPFI